MSPSVLVIARHYYPAPGAATNRLGAMVSALAAEGATVTVITRLIGDYEKQAGERGPHGESVIRVAGDSSTGVGLQRIIDLVAFPLRAIRAAKETGARFDVIVADPPPSVGLAMLHLAKRGGTRSVYYLPDSWRELLLSSPSRPAKLLAMPVGAVENYVLRRSNLVLSVTAGGSELVERAQGRAALFPNGVDGAVFHPHAAMAEPFSPPTQLPYFLYAGNFGEAHGADVFIEAAESLWQESGLTFALVYMGYGSARDKIVQASTLRPETLFVMPPQDAAVAASAYRQAVGGLASVRDDPNLRHQVSVKALASVMAGAPLVYAGTGTFVQEVESHDYGVAVPPTPEAVADALRAMLDNPRTWRQRLEIARLAAAKYDNRQLARRIARLCLQDID